LSKKSKQTVIGKEAALRAARFHRDSAASDDLRRYWNAVIKSIKEKKA
jgi:mannose/fructose-specific phosphotransferase system component IIA